MTGLIFGSQILPSNEIMGGFGETKEMVVLSDNL